MDNSNVDREIEVGIGAVGASTGIAVAATVLTRVNDLSTVAADLALVSWVVWAFVVAGWVTLVLLDAFVPVKAEPAVIENEAPEADEARSTFAGAGGLMDYSKFSDPRDGLPTKPSV